MAHRHLLPGALTGAVFKRPSSRTTHQCGEVLAATSELGVLATRSGTPKSLHRHGETHSRSWYVLVTSPISSAVGSRPPFGAVSVFVGVGIGHQSVRRRLQSLLPRPKGLAVPVARPARAGRDPLSLELDQPGLLLHGSAQRPPRQSLSAPTAAGVPESVGDAAGLRRLLRRLPVRRQAPGGLGARRLMRSRSGAPASTSPSPTNTSQTRLGVALHRDQPNAKADAPRKSLCSLGLYPRRNWLVRIDPMNSRFEVGDWFQFPNQQIVRRVRQHNQTFSRKPGTRPVILALRGQGAVSTILPRSSDDRDRESELLAIIHNTDRDRFVQHEKHLHRNLYPDCRINRDGWVVDFQVTVRNSDLARHGPKCKEDDNTGLLERIYSWLSI